MVPVKGILLSNLNRFLEEFITTLSSNSFPTAFTFKGPLSGCVLF